MIFNKILKIINSHEHVTIIDVTAEVDNEFITFALIIRVEVFKILDSQFISAARDRGFDSILDYDDSRDPHCLYHILYTSLNNLLNNSKQDWIHSSSIDVLVSYNILRYIK